MTLSRRRVAAGLLGASFVPFSLAHAQSAPTVADQAIVESVPAETPTQVGTGAGDHEHMMAPVSLNGQGPFQFVIDTGANASCVSRALADRLMLEAGPRQKVHTLVGARERPSVLIDHLQIGDRSRRKVNAPAMPFEGIDGVLGVDWLKGQRLEMKFKQKILQITNSRPDQATADTVIIPARRRLGQLTIVDADLGGHQISAMIDSGAQITLCNAPLRDLVMAAERRRNVALTPLKVGLETIAGESFTGELLYLPFLRLGGLQLGNVPVVYADMHIFGLWDLAKKPALILGMDLLTQFDAVSLDFGRSQVRFDMAEGTNAATRKLS